MPQCIISPRIDTRCLKAVLPLPRILHPDPRNVINCDGHGRYQRNADHVEIIPLFSYIPRPPITLGTGAKHSVTATLELLMKLSMIIGGGYLLPLGEVHAWAQGVPEVWEPMKKCYTPALARIMDGWLDKIGAPEQLVSIVYNE
jgi:hypothetical protein